MGLLRPCDTGRRRTAQLGRAGFWAWAVKHVRYDYETKVAAASAVVDGGMSKPEAMVYFGIASVTPLKNWCRLYRQDGVQALKPKPKDRPKGSGVEASKSLTGLPGGRSHARETVPIQR